MKVIITFIFMLITTSIFCQKNTLTNERFSLHLTTGLTIGLSPLSEFVEIPQFSNRITARPSLGIGAKFFHQKHFFISLDFMQYNFEYGATLEREIDNNQKSIIVSPGYFSTAFRFGRVNYFNNARWQHSYLLGANLDYIVSLNQDLNPSGNTTDFGLYNRGLAIEEGIVPSLQGGYQIAYRGNRMGLSLTLLGNLGLKTYGVQRYEIQLNGEQFLATHDIKGHFTSAILQYEFFFGGKVK